MENQQIKISGGEIRDSWEGIEVPKFRNFQEVSNDQDSYFDRKKTDDPPAPINANLQILPGIGEDNIAEAFQNLEVTSQDQRRELRPAISPPKATSTPFCVSNVRPMLMKNQIYKMDKPKRTCLDLPAIHPIALKELDKDKPKRTCLDVPAIHPIALKELDKDKPKRTWLDVPAIHPIALKELDKDKPKRTCLDVPGIHPIALKEFGKDKPKRTCLDVPGIHPIALKEFDKDKPKRTCLDVPGIHPIALKEFDKNKSRRTCFGEPGIHPIALKELDKVLTKRFNPYDDFRRYYTRFRLQVVKDAEKRADFISDQGETEPYLQPSQINTGSSSTHEVQQNATVKMDEELTNTRTEPERKCTPYIQKNTTQEMDEEQSTSEAEQTVISTSVYNVKRNATKQIEEDDENNNKRKLQDDENRIVKKRRIIPKPFSFDHRIKEMEERKRRKLEKVLEDQRKVRIFRARPIPKSVKCGSTIFGETVNKVEEKIKEPEQRPVIRAKPAEVLYKAPFEPQKLRKCTFNFQPPMLHTELRAKEREQFDKQIQEKEKLKQEKRKTEEALQRRQEQEEIAKLRRELVHKAQPIRTYKVLQQVAKRPLTEPITPKVAKRRRIGSNRE